MSIKMPVNILYMLVGGIRQRLLLIVLLLFYGRIDFRRIYQWHEKRIASSGGCFQEFRPFQCTESNL